MQQIMAKQKSSCLLPAGQQQPRELVKLLRPEMAELATVEGADRLIELREQVKAPRCNVHKDFAAVGVLAASTDEVALFKAVEQTGNIGIAGDHPRGNLAAQKAVRGAAQNAEYVVLIRGKVVFFEELCRAAGEQV